MEAIFLYVMNKFYLQYGADHIWHKRKPHKE